MDRSGFYPDESNCKPVIFKYCNTVGESRFYYRIENIPLNVTFALKYKLISAIKQGSAQGRRRRRYKK